MRLSSFARLACGFSLVALAACNDDATSPTQATQVRFVNAIANSAQLQLSINGVPVGGPVTFRSFTGCQTVNPGAFVLTVAAPGATVPLFTAPVTFDALGKYTLYATGTVAAPNYKFVSDGFTFPESGRALMRFFNALPTYGAVDAYITPDGSSLGASNASGLTFNTMSNYVNIPNDRSSVMFTPPSSTSSLAGEGPFDIVNRSAQTTIVAEDAGGGTPYRTFRVPACY